MSISVYFDDRWEGPHGIGRVARVFMDFLEPISLSLSGSPVSSIDPFRLSLKMLNLPKSSIVLSPGFNAPLLSFRPYIFMIHDLNHIDYVENSSISKRLYYAIVIKRACHFAYKILTVSEFSKKRIIDWAGVPAEKVVNVSNGVSEHFLNPPEEYTSDFQYLLCVSNRKSHKNERRIIQAFAQARIDPLIKLLFTGDSTRELVELAKELKVFSRITFLGQVLEKDLPGLYQGALSLVFPSLYEGFGLPVVEAMACGTPVLTSSTTSLPEVAGDAAILVDPTSVLEISDGIERIVKEDVLRKRLIVKGWQRAKLFDWSRVKSRVQNVLEECMVDMKT
ncbi:glycosyltransferase family 1 protein [Prosthecochloris sp.]|uniref:glycosyltransferase family 4 protein n=1 Tax=Prosthecochloris sp. TaxID=290513 RepID=UPI00257F879C|nr:glycosyltransferase family 1 protein [Prosthecochloris sp.]